MFAFKLKSDQHIKVELKVDELDLTAAESKSTYDIIKNYFLEKHSVKISSLCIAQTKKKHGIIEGDCHNKVKAYKIKTPQYLPEKEQLIEEALRHFKII